MKKLNVLFVGPPSIPYRSIIESFTKNNKITQLLAMPMGILYLSSYLKKHGLVNRVGVLDYQMEVNTISKYTSVSDLISSHADEKIDFIPDIIAFSVVFSTSHNFFKESLRILKSKWPLATTIIGGVHATNCAQALAKTCDFDYVCCGEGEIALCEFVNGIASQQTKKITGIHTKTDLLNMTTVATCIEKTEGPQNLDDLPFPDWDLLDMNAYTNARGRKREIGGAKDKKIATIMTTRGCPYKCTFCSSFTVHGRSMRYRSDENVMLEVKTLHEKFGVQLIIPEDDLFTVNRKRVISLLKNLKTLNIPNFELQFPSALSVNTLDEEVMDSLIDAGMQIGVLAVESGSPYTQQHIIKKNCNLNKAKHHVKYLQDKGIMVRCYFIMGFPGETKELMLETINFAKELQADWCNMNIAAPLVGTEMYAQLVARGDIKDDVDFWANAFFGHRHFDTPEIKASDLNELAYRANLEINFINNPSLVQKKWHKAISIFDDVFKTHTFHIIALNCMMKCYQELGDTEKFSALQQTSIELITNDLRAMDMYQKYQDLLLVPILPKNFTFKNQDSQQLVY